MKPIKIFICGFGVLVYAITVAILLDQIKERDKQLAADALRMNHAKSYEMDLKKESATRREAQVRVSELELQSAQTDNVIADVRSEIEALKARLIVEQLEQANAPVRPSSAVLSQPAQQLAPRQTATYPPWYPPAPSVVVKTIREQALAENKDNYSGANYEIERQTEAFDKLIRWQKMANPLINGLIAKAAFENGTKYSMIAYEVERQLEAKQRLDGK